MKAVRSNNVSGSVARATAVLERPGMLRREQVEFAKAVGSHAAIYALNAMPEGHWAKLGTALASLSKANMEHDALAGHMNDVCVKAFEPFAEALERSSYELGPLDIISVWAAASRVFAEKDGDSRNPVAFSYPFYHVAMALACCYGTSGIREGTAGYLYKGAGHTGFAMVRLLYSGSGSDSILFRDKVHEIEASLSDIEHYRFGTTSSMASLIRSAEAEGDAPGTATQELRDAEAWKEAHDDPVLASIHEHWSRALRWIK